MPFYPLPNFVQAAPANPSATVSATYVMMGLGAVAAPNTWALTPQVTGRVLLVATGDCGNNTTGDGVTAQLSFGTGTAPANGAAVTGTQIGGQVTFTALTGVLTVPIALTSILTNLTPGTAYWLDIALKAITGGSASLTNLSLIALEF